MNILLLEVFVDGFKNVLFHCLYTRFFMTSLSRYDFIWKQHINLFVNRFLSFSFIANIFL